MGQHRMVKGGLSIILFVAAFIALGNRIGVNADEAEDIKDKEDMHCKELIVESVKKAMKEVSKCTKSLGLKTKAEKKEKAACIMKCVAIHIGLLSPTGAIDEKLIMLFVDENVPTKYHDHAFSVMADCIHHADKVDPTEENCKSYEPIFKCVTESATKFAKMCTEDS